jgi:hypothetical protein
MKSKDIMSKTETGCCPRFDPKTWDNKTVTWENKIFAKSRITSFLHIPLNIGRVIKNLIKKIDDVDAISSDLFMLFDENSLWGADLYIEVTKDVLGAKMSKISGTFMTKVFEGPYSNMGKWAKEMESYVSKKGKKVKKMYFHYTTCPNCAKHYGKTYTVLFAQV